MTPGHRSGTGPFKGSVPAVTCHRTGCGDSTTGSALLCSLCARPSSVPSHTELGPPAGLARAHERVENGVQAEASKLTGTLPPPWDPCHHPKNTPESPHWGAAAGRHPHREPSPPETCQLLSGGPAALRCAGRPRPSGRRAQAERQEGPGHRLMRQGQRLRDDTLRRGAAVCHRAAVPAGMQGTEPCGLRE